MKKDTIKFWYTSDLHQQHHNILKYCPNRKFKTVEDMEYKIIKNFNRVIRPSDYLFILGDVFLGNKSKAKDFLSKINGKKICIIGNHDISRNQLLKIGFDCACDEMKLSIQGTQVILSHYPYRKTKFQMFWTKVSSFFNKNIRVDKREFEKAPIDNGMILLHGHTHQKDKVRGSQIHVGVDSWDMKPVSESDIASLISKIKKKENVRG